jgi:hypothetical protein
VLGLGVKAQTALAGCAVAAVVVAVLAVIRALALILALVPDSIKLATVVGMGLLLSFIGLQTAKIVVPDAGERSRGGGQRREHAGPLEAAAAQLARGSWRGVARSRGGAVARPAACDRLAITLVCGCRDHGHHG